MQAGATEADVLHAPTVPDMASAAARPASMTGWPSSLALAAPVVYGFADSCGGRATCEASAFAVTAFGQAVSLALLLVILPCSAIRAAARRLVVGGRRRHRRCDWIARLLPRAVEGIDERRGAHDGGGERLHPGGRRARTGERPGAVALIGIGVAIMAIVLVSGALLGARDPDPAADHRVRRASAVSASG